MNTRIQVEHTVTEVVTGVDLVREQVLDRRGRAAVGAQEDVVLRGHAIECRINAEDVSRRLPAGAGPDHAYREPAGPGVRVDSGVVEGSEISELYDPMIAKLIVRDADRERARRRMLRALEEFEIGGVKTLLGFHRALLEHPCFVEGETCHGVVESEELAARAEELSGRPLVARRDGRAASSASRRSRSTAAASRWPCSRPSRPAASSRAPPRARRATAPRRHRTRSSARCRARCSRSRVAEGDEVEGARCICIVEAMKMENELAAHRAGVVTELSVAPGQPVQTGQVICVLAGDE